MNRARIPALAAALVMSCGGRVGSVPLVLEGVLEGGSPGVASTTEEGGILAGQEAEAPSAPGPSSVLDAASTPDAPSTGVTTASCDVVANVSPSGANPYGPWSYGSTSVLGSTFTLYDHYFPDATGYNGINAWSAAAQVSLQTPYTTLPAAFDNPSTTAITVSTLTAQPGQFFLHPGPQGQYSIARWTAPRPGVYEVKATFEGIDDGPTTTDVHVLLDGLDAAASGYINLNGGTNSFSFTISLIAVAADTIDFALGDGGNGFANDSTALVASVCPTGVVPAEPLP